MKQAPQPTEHFPLHLQLMIIQSHTTSSGSGKSDDLQTVKGNQEADLGAASEVKDATTKMMISRPRRKNDTGSSKSFKNVSTILLWTDHDSEDIFWLVLNRRLTYLRNEVCPVLQECVFTPNKSRIREADTVLIGNCNTLYKRISRLPTPKRRSCVL